MELGTLDASVAEEILMRHGAEAVSLSDAGDDPQLEPAPGETPLWRELRISGLFDASLDVDALRADLASGLAVEDLPEHTLVNIAERAWEREWLQYCEPMLFGKRLWVCPGDARPPASKTVALKLDPGLAFGTGSHATTALMLEWLDGLSLNGKAVLDVGCGSGVLAIAALLLGAETATAIDIDSQALAATQDNARRNGVDDRLRLSARLPAQPARFDVVMANILASPLIDMAQRLGTLVNRNGLLALSGILADQTEAVCGAYAQQFRFDAPTYRLQDGQRWARLTGIRAES